jgi:predicted acetyltransferase
VDLRLRPFAPSDEFVARQADEASRQEIQRFLWGLNDEMAWAEYLEFLDKIRLGKDLAPNMVRGANLAAVAQDELVGRVSIRFELNDSLLFGPGHIGYHVIEHYRGRGHATEMLKQSLVLTRAEGIDVALVTCDVDNAASVSVISKCGGEFLDIVSSSVDGKPIKRFLIR